MTTADTVIIAVLFIALTMAVIAWFVIQRQRSLRLKQHFGSEYDFTVAEFRSRTRTEEELWLREQELFEVAADRIAAPPPLRRVAVHS